MVQRFVVCGLLLTLSLASFGGDKPGAKLPPPPNADRGFHRLLKYLMFA